MSSDWCLSACNSHRVSVKAVMADGTTIVSGNWLLIVPPMSSQAGPSAGVSGAGSRSIPNVSRRITFCMISGCSFITAKVMFISFASGARSRTSLSIVSCVVSNKSIR